ncbi:MAG: VOC family protein [Ignavibacteria bacterium]
MNTQINVYLTFNGNAKEAMTFYKDVLGGELSVMKVSDTPVKDKAPADNMDKVMHASLVNGNLILFATDMIAEGKFNEGTGVTMNLNCSIDYIQNFFDKLSEGGEVIHPVKEEFWGGSFGVLRDKFGKKWMLHAENKK